MQESHGQLETAADKIFDKLKQKPRPRKAEEVKQLMMKKGQAARYKYPMEQYKTQHEKAGQPIEYETVTEYMSSDQEGAREGGGEDIVF